MKKVITTMLVAAMVLSMAVPTSAATITRKKSTGTTASTTKVSGDYSLKMVDKTLQFIRGGKVVSSVETKDGKITLRKSSAGGISVVFTDANGKRRNITLGKQDSVALSGTFVQVSVDKALGSSFEVEMEKGSKVTNFYAKGAAKVSLNGSVTTLNVTSSNANVAANGTVSRAYAVNKKSISGMSAGKITQTSTGTSSNGSVNTATKSSNSSNTTVNSGSGSSGGSSSGGSSGIIINGGGSNGDTTTAPAPKISQQPVSVEIEEGKSATLSIKATATGKISYQWYDAKTGKAIAGATSSTLTVSPKENTSYYCLVTNTVGSKKTSVRSNTVSVTIKGQTVVAKPVITKDPTDVTVEVGNPATLKVEVEAVAGLTPKYQWYTTNNDGTTPVNTIIDKATEATYTVTPDVAGTTSYYCTVINENKDGVKSEPATSKTVSITATAKVADEDLAKAKAAIEALKGPYVGVDEAKAAIKAAVTNKDITVDDSKVALSEDGKTIAGDVGLSIEVDGKPVTATAKFSARVEGKEGTAEKPVFKAPLKDASYTLDKAVALDGTATVPSNTAITYQWYKGTSSDTTKGDEIPGATNATYTPTSLGSFYYYVVATNTVGTSVETAVSEPAYVTVTMPAGAAAIPTFTKDLNPNTDSKNYDLGSPDVSNLSVTATATGKGAKISYQWYSSTSASTDGGTKIDGATNATFTPDTSVAGVTYYYCVATNTDSEATLEGYTTASVASKSVKITVAANNTMAVVSSNGADGTANTTTIELTFKYPMRGLKASDFTITPPVEDPVLESKVAITGLEEFNGGKTIKLTVSGVAKTDNKKVFSLKLANLPDGITMSKDTVAVTIFASSTPAPVADAKVVTAIANGSAGTKDTDTITVTFDKDPSEVAAKDFKFTGATVSVDADAVTGTGTTRVVKVTLGGAAGTDADKKITMTQAGKDTTSTDIEVNRDTTPPEYFGAVVENTDPDTVVLTFKEKLDAGATVTKNDFVVKVNGTDVATTAESVTVDGLKVKIKLANNLTDKDSVIVSYKGTTITDASVAKNPAAKFDNQTVDNNVKATASPKLAEASLSADGGTLNVAFDRPVKASSDPNVAALDKCIKIEGVPDGVTYTVTLTDAPTRAANNRYLKIVFSRALTAEESAKLQVTFEVPSDKKSPITDLAGTEMVDNTTPVTPDTDNVAEKAAGTATAQAGTGKKDIVVKLTAGKFNATADDVTATGSWTYAGTSAAGNAIKTIVRDSDTQVTITLTNDIKNSDVYTIKPLAAALDTTVAAEPVTPFTVTVSAATVSATASGTVTGVPGTALASNQDITITLADGAFNAVAAGANTWITNLPKDLTASIAAVTADATQATITVSGTPAAAASGNIEITIPKEAIKGATADLVIKPAGTAKYAIGAQQAVISSVEGAYESDKITVTLTSGKFDETGAATKDNWTVTGATVTSVAYTDEKTAVLTLNAIIPSTKAAGAITVKPNQAAFDTATTTAPDSATTVTLKKVTAAGDATMTASNTSVTVSLSKGSFNTSATGTTGWSIGGTDASGNTVTGVSITNATTATVTVNAAINSGSTVTLTIPQAAFVTDTTTAPSAIGITIS